MKEKRNMNYEIDATLVYTALLINTYFDGIQKECPIEYVLKYFIINRKSHTISIYYKDDLIKIYKSKGTYNIFISNRNKEKIISMSTHLEKALLGICKNVTKVVDQFEITSEEGECWIAA